MGTPIERQVAIVTALQWMAQMAEREGPGTYCPIPGMTKTGALVAVYRGTLTRAINAALAIDYPGLTLGSWLALKQPTGHEASKILRRAMAIASL